MHDTPKPRPRPAGRRAARCGCRPPASRAPMPSATTEPSASALRGIEQSSPRQAPRPRSAINAAAHARGRWPAGAAAPASASSIRPSIVAEARRHARAAGLQRRVGDRQPAQVGDDEQRRHQGRQGGRQRHALQRARERGQRSREHQGDAAEEGAPEADSKRMHRAPTIPAPPREGNRAAQVIALHFRAHPHASRPFDSAPMSTVFNFTFVPWFRSVAPYIHMHRGKTFVVGMAGEADRRRQAAAHRAGPGADPEHGRQDRAGARLPAAGERAAQGQGPCGAAIRTACASPTRSRSTRAQEAAGQLRYEIEAAFSQGLPNTPMAGSTVRVISGNFITARPVGVLDGVDFKHSRPGAQGRRRRHHAARWISARWCCCRRSASRPPARPST